MDKSPDAFRTISEVAIDLDLPQHVLRFWETRFAQIKPLKRGGGRRYYRPDDVDLLKGIRHLLYGEGYTIRGVQRILKEQGVRFVMNVWRDGAPQPPPSAGNGVGVLDDRAEPAFDEDVEFDAAEDTADQPPDDAYSPYAPHHLAPASPPRPADHADFAVPMVRAAEPAPHSPRDEPRSAAPTVTAEAEGAAALAQRFAPRFVDAEAVDEAPSRSAPPLTRANLRPAPEMRAAPLGDTVPVPPRPMIDTPAAPAPAPPNGRVETRETPRPGFGQIFDRLRSGGGREAEATATPRATQALSRDEIRRLQSTLFELLECKRLLDQVR